MRKPLVSIIIPTYNSERTIEKCLQSVKNQTYENIELIVVDNNSKDRTPEISKKYADQLFNQGPERSAQRNYGVNQASGEYVLIHDSDIYFDPNTVSECVDILEQKSDVGAVIIPEESIGTGFWAKFKAYERSHYVGLDLIESPRFFRKTMYQKVGGFNEELNAAEDWDLDIRIRNITKVARAKFFVQHDEGEVNPFKVRSKKDYYRKYFEKYESLHPEEYKKQINPFYRYKPKKLFIDFFTKPHLVIGMIIMRFLETGVLSFITKRYEV